MKVLKLKNIPLNAMLFGAITILIAFLSISSAGSTQSLTQCTSGNICTTNNVRLTAGQCGYGSNAVKTSIAFGCVGDKCVGNNPPASCTDGAKLNPITDILFAIIKFLSAGVGLVIVASVIIGGIQYITSRGDPNATQAAIRRLTSSVVALLIFIFAYAILNYVIPGGFFK